MSTIDTAAQRGFDLLACAPGPHPYGAGAPSDDDIVRAIADILALQQWRQDKGLSTTKRASLLAAGVITARVEADWENGGSSDA